eukprot:GFUD01124587.1.p1 GENE.GFUD01124587.1~~GFUD01124587.1.p1  ORF type:complete len:360 (+),score=158.63 GFUD01124587.1:182-1261(+)
MTKRVLSPGYRDLLNYYKSRPAASSDSEYNADHASLDRYNQDDDDVIVRHEDGDIEEDVLDLSIQVQQLQQQVDVLAESQLSTDDLYVRAKQDNAGLNTRIFMLEEQTRELEGKGEEKVKDEQKRHNDLMVRVERMKNLEIENYTIRLQNMERENMLLVTEVTSLKQQVERIRIEKDEIGENLGHTQALLLREQEQHMMLQESKVNEEAERSKEKLANSQIVQEKIEEIRDLRQSIAEQNNAEPCKHVESGMEVPDEISAHVREKETEIRAVRRENQKLTENNEELQAQLLNRQVREGRSLLAGPQGSLAADMGTMTDEQLRKSLSEQKDINLHLQTYIDSVLLNIMERYPELLEIRNK